MCSGGLLFCEIVVSATCKPWVSAVCTRTVMGNLLSRNASEKNESSMRTGAVSVLLTFQRGHRAATLTLWGVCEGAGRRLRPPPGCERVRPLLSQASGHSMAASPSSSEPRVEAWGSGAFCGVFPGCLRWVFPRPGMWRAHQEGGRSEALCSEQCHSCHRPLGVRPRSRRQAAL